MCCVSFCMGKAKSFLAIVGIIFIFMAVALVAVGYYLYEYHVFETTRLCVGGSDGNLIQNTTVSCNVAADCLDYAKENGIDLDLVDAPAFVRENYEMLIEEVVFCDGYCGLRDVKGFDIENWEMARVDSCAEGEKEILIEIRGKDALGIWAYLDGRE